MIEIIEQDKLIEKEIKAGIIPDPAEMQIDPRDWTCQFQEKLEANMDLGKPQLWNQKIDGSATEAARITQGWGDINKL